VDISVKSTQDGAVRRIYQEFRVALVGAVKSFKRGPGRGAFDLMTRFQGMNAKPYDEPPVVDVPVIHPSGDNYGMWFDMTEKDLAVVLCCDGPVRGTFENGTAVTPGAGAQSHTFGCAVAFPGGRVSSTETPTAPPNDPGTGLCGGGDKTACVVYRRAGHPLLPGELGTVVIHAAGPTASVKAGGDTAAIPVACAPQTDANFDLIGQIFQALPAVPGDPGIIAALKVAFGVAYTAALQATADAKLVVEGPLPGP
jgi:hypothetical protein